jgi:tRNA-dihydrouridine synthase
MAEISHRALRVLIEDFGGCDGYFSEMISAPALLANGPFEKWYIDPAPRPDKCIFQLVGSDMDIIAKAAAFLDKLECAGIDINMGCSAPLIRKSGAGAAWMASIDRAGELISRVRPQVKKRLSVKLRIGFKEDPEYLIRFCQRLEGEGVELITLHPRTVMEKFKRLARWEYVGKLKQELKIPVCGNGDISNAEELNRRAAGHCDAVMVGRAAVRQPWIFAQAREIKGSDQKYKEGNQQNLIVCSQEGEACVAEKQFLEFSAGGDRVSEGYERLHKRAPPNVFTMRTPPSLEEVGLKFVDLLAQYQPLEFHISRAKRFFGFFCDNLKWGTYLKNQINREQTLAGVERVWKEFFREKADGSI